ncbi:helix-turn-helix transcriptional regulator [Porcipelethomonas sp.]|uniref:helix-turn-helix transcriptional regulator n=1 Tax=Porcipelethomonas sp. TaxID=2981675 RepID=UPI003EF975D9
MNYETEIKIAESLFSQREENFGNDSFDREIAFYESICSGDIALVKMLVTPLGGKGYGILSKDSLQNLKYHFAISAALIARFCVKSGMTPETAYQLSDYYIMKADESNTQEEIHDIHMEMLESYTLKMRSIRNSKTYSKPIAKAIDYVGDHLHSRILIEDVADYLQLSMGYLSRMFKSETGISFSDYVNSKKIEAASTLIRFSDYSDLEISNLLSFSSHSYFIKVFRKYTGMTPKEYKKSFQIPDLKPNPQKPL